MRIVDPKHAHALTGPKSENVSERRPEVLPVSTLEVERVDVLVLFRRVFGVANRPVRTLPEPVGVLLDPGVVGGGVKRNVERNLDMLFSGRRHKPLERGHSAELGVYLGEAAVFAANCVRTAGFILFGGRRVVLTFAKTFADGVNRRQIGDIETHLLDVVQVLGGVVECSVLAALTE